MPTSSVSSSPAHTTRSDATSGDATSLSRRERERLRRRQAMLRAARAVFAEKGYARATLDEIAERAEFGKGTLYNYFEGGKEEILFAVFDEVYDDMSRLIAEVVEADPERSTRAVFHDLVTRAFGYFLGEKDLFMILVKEAYRHALGDDRERAAYFHAQREGLVTAMVPAIERGQAAGTVREAPAHAVAHMLLENLDGLLIHRLLRDRFAAEDAEDACTDGLIYAPAQAADFLTSMLFDGLAPRGA